MPRFSKIEYDPAPSNVSREIISPSQPRIAILIYPPSVGRVTLSNDPITGDGNGLVLAAGQAPLALTHDYHGDVVNRAFFALYSAGATGVGWIQTLP